MNVYELVLKNRSYRSFQGSQEIPYETLSGFVDSARLTMSSVNLQPLKYCIVSDKKTCERVREHTYWARLLKGYDGPDAAHSPSAYIVVLHDKSVAPNVERFHKDVGICSQTIMLAAVEAGYGGCMIGNFDVAEVSEILGLPENLAPQLVLALGVPDETIQLEEIEKDEPTAYYRDENDLHHVPKRKLADIIIPHK